MAAGKPRKSAQEKTTMGASLISQMLTILVNMLNYVTGDKAPTITIEHPVRVNGGGKKGSEIKIQFNLSLFVRIARVIGNQVTKQTAAFGKKISRAERKKQQSSEEELVETSNATGVEDHPFVAFIKEQLLRIINAPNHVCQVGEHKGESFWNITVDPVACYLQVSLHAWAVDAKFWSKTRKGKTLRPFISLKTTEVKSMMKSADLLPTRKQEKDGDNWKQKARKARQHKTDYMNAIFSMATILGYAEGFKLPAQDRSPLGAYVVQRGGMIQAHHELAGTIGKVEIDDDNGKAKTAFKVELAESQLAFYAPNKEKRGKSFQISASEAIQQVMKAIENDDIDFQGAQGPKTKKFFSGKKPEDLVRKAKGRIHCKDEQMSSAAEEVIFSNNIGPKKLGRTTIAEQLKITKKRVGKDTIGGKLMNGFKQGTFFRMLFSFTAPHMEPINERMVKNGFGQFDQAAFKDGIPDSKAGAFAVEHLHSKEINFKAFAAGARYCDPKSCKCMLCNDEQLDEQWENFMSECGANNFRNTVCIPVQSRDDVPTGKTTDISTQARILKDLKSHSENLKDSRPPFMEADAWAASTGVTYVSVKYCLKAPEGYDGPGMNHQTGVVEFVTLAAVHTHKLE